MRQWKTSKAGNKQRGRVLFKHFLESFAVKTQQKQTTITSRDNAKTGNLLTIAVRTSPVRRATATVPRPSTFRRPQRSWRWTQEITPPIKRFKNVKKIWKIDLFGRQEANVVMQGRGGRQHGRAPGRVGEGCRVDLVSEPKEWRQRNKTTQQNLPGLHQQMQSIKGNF